MALYKTNITDVPAIVLATPAKRNLKNLSSNNDKTPGQFSICMDNSLSTISDESTIVYKLFSK